MVVSALYLACDMDFHYLTFMGRNLENTKRLMLIRIMNNACTNIVNSVGNFNISVAMNSVFSE